MAFVFENPRWVEKVGDQELGPGTYHYQNTNKIEKGAYILPQKKIVKTIKDQPEEIMRDSKVYIEDQKRQKIRKMYAKLKTKTKRKDNITNKENIEIFSEKIQNFTSNNFLPIKKQKKGDLIDRKAKIYHILNKEKSIPSLAREQHEGLCISNIQIRKAFTRSATFNKINYKRHQIVKNFHECTNLKSNQLIIGQNNSNKIKNSINLSTRNLKTADHQSRSAKMHKKMQLFKQSCNIYQERPTGIEDSSDSSLQYIEDSTPGPGSYNICQPARMSKKNIGKFGITVSRFPKTKIYSFTDDLNIDPPNFKKSTKASQQLVAFGSGKIQQKESNKNSQPQKFFQDQNSIEQKSLKNLVKHYYKPGFFLSKNTRFQNKKIPEFYGPDFYQRQENIEQQNKYLNTLSSVFLSKVERINNINETTKNIDFKGQQHYTIKNKIHSPLQIDRQPIAFLADSPRFKYQQPNNDLILLNKLNIEAPKQEKVIGYTFNKFEFKDKMLNQTSVGQYEVSKTWMKPSYNIKFQAFDKL